MTPSFNTAGWVFVSKIILAVPARATNHSCVYQPCISDYTKLCDAISHDEEVGYTLYSTQCLASCLYWELYYWDTLNAFAQSWLIKGSRGEEQKGETEPRRETRRDGRTRRREEGDGLLGASLSVFFPINHIYDIAYHPGRVEH